MKSRSGFLSYWSLRWPKTRHQRIWATTEVRSYSHRDHMAGPISDVSMVMWPLNKLSYQWVVEDGSHLQDVSCACGRYATGIPETKITSGRADQLLMYYWGYWYKYHYLDNDVIAFASCLPSLSTHGRRTETPPSPQHGDVRSTTPSTKCKCHCYLALSGQTLTLGAQPHNHDGTAPQRRKVLPWNPSPELYREAEPPPLDLPSTPKRTPQKTSSYLRPAPQHAEMNLSSSTTGRQTEESESSYLQPAVCRAVLVKIILHNIQNIAVSVSFLISRYCNDRFWESCYECFSGQSARMESLKLLLPPLSVCTEEHS